MEKAKQSLIGYLNENPSATKIAISEGIGMKGLFLFNVLKKLIAEGTVIETADGEEKQYSLATIDGGSEELGATKEENPVVEEEINEEQSSDEKKKIGRDNSKFKFNGELYGKGPLVRAIVARYVKDHPETTHDQLKEVFPDELLKRFGIFQEEKQAKKIATKGNRYFSKPEQVIQLKDAKIIVCSQFTLENIQPFLKVARGLGYKIKR